MRHRAKSQVLRRYGELTVFFQNGGRPPSWICRARIGTTYEDYFVVFIVEQNLVGIDSAVTDLRMREKTRFVWIFY